MRHKLDIDINKLDSEQRKISSVQYPTGIYTCLAELVENEYNIPFEQFCYEQGIDTETNRYSTYIVR